MLAWWRTFRVETHSYQGADKSLAQPGGKQARKNVRDARDFNNIEARSVIKVFFLQGKAPKEIQAKTLVCFLSGRVKDLSALLNNMPQFIKMFIRSRERILFWAS